MLKLALLALITSITHAQVPLKPGDPAPDFQAQDQHGQLIRLRDFRGKALVALYFYPKDDTPGCTAQACSLRDGYADLKKAGVVVLGVSADDVRSHAAFAGKYKLPFSLLADPDKKIIKAYGTQMTGLSLAKRWTFLIDRQGVIRAILTDVKTKTHDQEVLQAVKALG